MIPDRHWWRTADGRLVPDGDRDAAILAYPRGHEIADNLAEQVGLAAAVRALTGPDDVDESEPETGGDEHGPQTGEDGEAKQADTPADKMAPKPADKARPGPGRRPS